MVRKLTAKTASKQYSQEDVELIYQWWKNRLNLLKHNALIPTKYYNADVHIAKNAVATYADLKKNKCEKFSSKEQWYLTFHNSMVEVWKCEPKNYRDQLYY